jgi:hypothetical protein
MCYLRWFREGGRHAATQMVREYCYGFFKSEDVLSHWLDGSGREEDTPLLHLNMIDAPLLHLNMADAPHAPRRSTS